MIKIFNDFLDKNFQNEVEKVVKSHHFHWYFNPCTITNDKENSLSWKNVIDKHQFYHIFYIDGKKNSPFFDMAMKVIEPLKLQYKNLVRIKANVVSNVGITDYNHMQPVHTDYHTNECKSLIYYITDSDGDTWFFNKDKSKLLDKIYPKKGRAVLFNSNTPHCGSHPIKYDTRFVINYVLRY
jgi:hypothetical protein